MPTLPGLAIRFVAAAFAALLAVCLPLQAAEADGTFALISDIHLNPFDPKELATKLVADPVENWHAVFSAIESQPM